MQDTVPSGTGLTQLTAINIAKGLTLTLLLAYAIGYGVQDFRQVLYLCLHGGYCLWWLLEQWLFPLRRQQIFTDPVGLGELIGALLIVGGFYSLPGFLAFTNPTPLGLTTAAIALLLYLFGSLINATADIQKLTAKQYGAGLVQDGIWRLARHVNYLGDLLRYLSFSVLAGSAWAYLLPGLIGLLYLQRIGQKEEAMAQKYPEYGAYQKATSRLIPFIW